MNTKTVKHYEILNEFFGSDMLKAPVVDKYFGALLKLDYAKAEELWEYMLIRNDGDLGNSAFSALYVDRVYGIFNASSSARTVKTILEVPVIERAVFQFSPAVSDGELFTLPVNLLVANKTDAVDGILKLVCKNEAMKPSFGEYMIKFLDRFFIEMMKKDVQRRVRLNNKQSALLLSTVQKVRGDERAMLVQRIKEVK